MILLEFEKPFPSLLHREFELSQGKRPRPAGFAFSDLHFEDAGASLLANDGNDFPLEKDFRDEVFVPLVATDLDCKCAHSIIS